MLVEPSLRADARMTHRWIMLTLLLRYTIDPNKLADFRAYVDAELPVIRRCGAARADYYLPTDFAGATSEAYGLIDFASLAAYEVYRGVLGDDPESKRNRERLAHTGAVRSTDRSIIARA